MKTLRLIAVLSIVAAGAVLLVQGDDDVPKNQNKTNQVTIAPMTPDGPSKELVKSVIDHYLRIQAALADDSMGGVSTNAAAISEAVKADKAKIFSPEAADAANALAKAKDVSIARESFKDLSQSLIKYLSDRKVRTGELDEVFCPMANAYWLQTNKDIANPYLGHSMPGCGEIKRTF
jgi:Cu(I)/Ag(I) efflux system membrane fusion protein